MSYLDKLVFLKCVKEGSKLRIKIISPGFHNEANCQFPRNIRVENRKYSVPIHAVSFAEGPNHKFFYRINKSYIKIESDNVVLANEQDKASKLIDKVFENDTIECTVCMENDKETVFARCGHYICCEDCSMEIFTTTKKCPICRSKIESVVKREFVQI